MSRSRFGLVVLVLFTCNSVLLAELKLASIFSDHMVLQRHQPIRVWGAADANAVVQIQLGDDRATATAGADGAWRATLNPAGAGGPHELRVTSGDKALKISDVLIGDVFLCSGQSNMQMTLWDSDGGPDEAKSSARLGNVRLLMVPKAFAEKPKDTIDGKWTSCAPETSRNFSAVAFYFAQALRQSPWMADVPIGLIDSSFGGTCVEGWISREALDASYKPADLRDSMFGIKPAHLYNAMIAPLTPLNLKGVLWYQGESNAPNAELYERLLTTMIGEWRTKFGDEKLPFFIVQLPNYPGLMEGASFVWIREAQANVAANVADTFMAVTIDTPDGVDLHPRAKRMVGQRLALLAREHLYGETLVSTGPIFKSARVEGDRIRVEFDTGGAKLKARGDTGVDGFLVAGADGVYRNALARIDGSAVLVSSELVPSPKTVRYAWLADPQVGLYGDAGLPAAPFRTDSLPMHPIIQATRTPTVRRVSTSNYTLTLDGDGTISSLVIGDQQMLSNDGPGFMAVGWFGTPRQLFRVQELAPDCVKFSDSGASVRYEFTQSGISIQVRNDTGEPIPVRLLMSAGAKLTSPPTTQPGDQPVVFSREKARLAIAGVEKMSAPAAGPSELTTSVPGRSERIFTILISHAK